MCAIIQVGGFLPEFWRSDTGRTLTSPKMSQDHNWPRTVTRADAPEPSGARTSPVERGTHWNVVVLMGLLPETKDPIKLQSNDLAYPTFWPLDRPRR